jgi:hypothetical protein
MVSLRHACPMPGRAFGRVRTTLILPYAVNLTLFQEINPAELCHALDNFISSEVSFPYSDEKGRDPMEIDRIACSQALAKAIAYRQVNKEAEAQEWGRRLIRLLELADILKNDGGETC